MFFLKLPLKILHLEDNLLEAEIIKEVLIKEGLNVKIYVVDNREDFLFFLKKENFDVILSDYLLPSFDGMSALELAKEKYPHIPFLFVSGKIGEDLIIEAIKKGAKDYVFKNRLSDLLPRINRVLQEIGEQRRVKETKGKVEKSCSVPEKFNPANLDIDIGRLSEFIDFQTQLLTSSGNKEIIEKIKEKRENLKIDNIIQNFRDMTEL